MRAQGFMVVLVAAGLAMTAAVAAAGTATPVGESASDPLVGTWRRTTTCAELVSALKAARAPQKMVLEFVAGNGFVPGVSSPDQILDAGAPCVGAIPRQHSHFFTKNGAFGSLDWKGQPVDDGRYKIMRRGTVVVFKEFPKVTFNYRIRGRALSLNPIVPKGCSSFRCAWAISVAYPGKTWQRVR